MAVDLHWKVFSPWHKKMPQETKNLHAEVDRCIDDMKACAAALDEQMYEDPTPPRHLNLVNHGD